jgi:hypothetical protein
MGAEKQKVVAVAVAGASGDTDQELVQRRLGGAVTRKSGPAGTTVTFKVPARRAAQ